MGRRDQCYVYYYYVYTQRNVPLVTLVSIFLYRVWSIVVWVMAVIIVTVNVYFIIVTVVRMCVYVCMHSIMLISNAYCALLLFLFKDTGAISMLNVRSDD